MECAVSPSCIEEAEGCMCPLIKKILSLQKITEKQDKILKKLNNCKPTTFTPKPNCVKAPEPKNVLCPTVQKVVDCWEKATSCDSKEDICLINDIETILSTATKCEIQKPQPCCKKRKKPKHKKPSKCDRDYSRLFNNEVQ